MAQFEGTIREFTKFIGAYARIKVKYLAARHKKNIGKCEECGSETKTLQAAHIRGRERPLIISNILAQFIEQGIVKIDLQEFEDKYIEAHIPIENTIRVLCNECHRQYDKSKVIHEFIPIDSDIKSGNDPEKYEEKESELIAKLVAENFKKSKALILINQQSQLGLNNSNTIFSNINSSHDVWWLEPHNDRFNDDLNLILHDSNRNTLYVFRLPAREIKNPKNVFHQRNDKVKSNCSQMVIPLSDKRFVDKKGYDFTKYLLARIQY